MSFIYNYWDHSFCKNIKSNILASFGDIRYIICIGSPIKLDDKKDKKAPVYKFNKEKPPLSDFSHCERDFKWKIKCAKEKEPFIPKVKVFHCKAKFEEGITKNELLKHLIEQCEEAVKVGTMTLSIFYSGHGREKDGAWKTC